MSDEATSALPRLAYLCLAVANRIGPAALLLLVGGVIGVYFHRPDEVQNSTSRAIFPLAFALADLGFIASIIAWTIALKHGVRHSGAMGTALFNLILILILLWLLIMDHSGKLAAWVAQFKHNLAPPAA